MNVSKRGLLVSLAMVGLLAAVALSGCLQTSELECMGGTTECNVTCVYLNVDPANCGACGLACQPRAICVAPTDGGGLGSCECPAALTLCGATCSDITTDPNNCGACAGAGGAVCTGGQVCAPTPDGGGACQLACGTAVECNGACVTLDTDTNNCGMCGNICAQGYDCHPTPQGALPGTCLPDVVVACNAGTVAPIFDSPLQPVAGPGVPAGSFPGGLGILGDGLLVGAEGALGELVLENLSLVSTEAPPLGSGPDFVEVDTRSDAGSWVYVVDGNVNTLTVLTGPPAATAELLLSDGGAGALGLVLDGGYIFGPNTVPEPYARLGNEIFVPLYGGYPPTQMAGGTVVRLDVTNPSVPVLVGSYDMKLVPLQTFDGGLSDPRPSQALVHEGLVYVVLNNLVVDPVTGFYDSAGPSVLVKIDPGQPPDGGTGGISQVVTLDAGVCLNAVAMAESVSGLLVTCSGQAQFDPITFATLSVDRSAVLSLDVNDNLLASWSPLCPAAGPACTPPIASPLGIVNGRAYVGDSSAGRVFVVSIGPEGQLTELVGYGSDGGVPLQPCPVGESAVSVVLPVP